MLTANIGNGLLWFAYGLAVHDWFLIMPNGIGATFSFLSLVISLMFPATERNERLKHGTPDSTQQQQQQRHQSHQGSFNLSRRVSDCEAAHSISGATAGTRSLSWLTGVARMPGGRRAAGTAAASVLPLAAEAAISGPGRVLEAHNQADAAEPAEQQTLCVHRGAAVSRADLGEYQDGKDSSIV
jgi:hypothetical protein